MQILTKFITEYIRTTISPLSIHSFPIRSLSRSTSHRSKQYCREGPFKIYVAIAFTAAVSNLVLFSADEFTFGRKRWYYNKNSI